MNLGRSLVLSGLVWHSRRYATSVTLIQHEEEARAEEKGLWAQSDPTPLWEYRDARRETSLLEAVGEGVDAAQEGYRWVRWVWRVFS